MGCSSTSSKKRPNYKSCVRYYNNTSQPLPANTTTQLTIAGSRVVDTGVSMILSLHLIQSQLRDYIILAAML